MKHEIIAVLIAVSVTVISALVTYLLGAWISWEPNPGEWEQKSRALSAFLGVIFPMIAGTVLGFMYYDKRKNFS